jgi:DNA-binding XRE family transcriptional regulator
MKKKIMEKPKEEKMRPKCFIFEMCSKRGVSVYEFARGLGYHPNNFYTYIKGKSSPNVSLALKMAERLECKVEDLFKF